MGVSTRSIWPGSDLACHDELPAAYQQIIETLLWPTGLDREACAVADQVELYGLDALPDSCQELTSLASGAVLSGTVRCVIGRDLLLDTPDGPLLADTRLLAGWLLHPTTAAPTGLQRCACDYAPNEHDAAPSIPVLTPPPACTRCWCWCWKACPARARPLPPRPWLPRTGR